MTRTPLLFVKNATQLKRARALDAQMYRQARIIGLSAASLLEPAREPASISLASELLTSADLTEVRRQARALTDSWHASVTDQLDHHGVNLARVSRIEHLWFFREVSAARIVADRLVSTDPPSRVYLFSDRTPCLDAARLLGTHGVCEAVFAHVFRSAGVEVVHLRPVRPDVPAVVMRNLRRAVWRWRARKQATPPPAETRDDSTRTVAALGEDYDLFTLASFLDVVSERRSCGTTLVNTADYLARPHGRAGMDPAVQHLNPVELPRYAAPLRMDIARTLWRTRAIFERERRSLPAAELSAPGLASHFDGVWMRWEGRLMPHIDAVERYLSLARPDVVVTATVERATDRATVEVARGFGIKTVGIQHGYLGDVDAYDFSTDSFVAWGDAGRALLAEELSKDPSSIAILPPASLVRLHGPERPRTEVHTTLLALTSRFTPACYDALDWRDWRTTWEEIVAYVERRPGLRLIVKPHPGISEPLTFYRSAIARLGERATVVTDRRLEDIAGDVDAVIAVADTTTAVLVAQLLQLPTLYIRTAWNLKSRLVSDWGRPDGLESIDRVEQIPKAITQLLDDESFRKGCLERGSALLKREMAMDADAPETALQTLGIG